MNWRASFFSIKIVYLAQKFHAFNWFFYFQLRLTVEQRIILKSAKKLLNAFKQIALALFWLWKMHSIIFNSETIFYGIYFHTYIENILDLLLVIWHWNFVFFSKREQIHFRDNILSYYSFQNGECRYFHGYFYLQKKM